MKPFQNLLLLLAAAVLILSACTAPQRGPAGVRVPALDAAAWDHSEWISAADAPVVSGRNAVRAADGASWFVSTVKNPRRVTEARWMATGLGVFELYVNGCPVGTEILKPGFTHPLKTRRSFTYDVTCRFKKGAGERNYLAAVVSAGWWRDKIVNFAGKKSAFRAVLEVTFADGSTKGLPLLQS